MSAAEKKAVFLSYASPSFARPTEGRPAFAKATEGRQDARTIYRKERKEHKEVNPRLDGSLRSLRSLRLTSVT